MDQITSYMTIVKPSYGILVNFYPDSWPPQISKKDPYLTPTGNVYVFQVAVSTDGQKRTLY